VARKCSTSAVADNGRKAGRGSGRRRRPRSPDDRSPDRTADSQRKASEEKNGRDLGVEVETVIGTSCRVEQAADKSQGAVNRFRSAEWLMGSKRLDEAGLLRLGPVDVTRPVAGAR
jgi:hypothetical protein